MHLVIMAVATGGFLDFDNLTPPTSSMMWLSEEASITDAAIERREEALFVDLSASLGAAHTL